MPLSDADDAVARLLSRDVATTLGAGYESLVQACASGARDFIDEADWYARHVVEEVQQYFHDMRIDTTWPACPRHPNHPLWFKNGWWCCERDALPVSRLGELAGNPAEKAR